MFTMTECLCVEVGLIDYKAALNLQRALVDRRHDRGPDVLLLVEHPHVFTLGRRGRQEGLIVAEAFLEGQDIPLVHVERGGDITYHGPGQLVGYPIMNLRDLGWKVVDFVWALEEIVIRTLSDWGIVAQRNPLNRGAWVGMDKIGSVGVAVRRGVSFHGFALNVNTSLEPFEWIHPCGLKGIGVTTVERILGEKVPMAEVRKVVKHHIQEIFSVTLRSASPEDLQDILNLDHWGERLELGS